MWLNLVNRAQIPASQNYLGQMPLSNPEASLMNGKTSMCRNGEARLLNLGAKQEV